MRRPLRGGRDNIPGSLDRTLAFDNYSLTGGVTRVESVYYILKDVYACHEGVNYFHESSSAKIA